MIPLENVPRTGILIISVYWNGYKGYYQNDTRRILLERVPSIDEENNLDLNLQPLQFSLIKTITIGGLKKDGKKKTISRANGAEYHYSFKNMTAEKCKFLYKELKKLERNFAWWHHIDFMFASSVEGLE